MKTYRVLVKTKQRVNEVTLSADSPDTLIVKTTAMPVDGSANSSVIALVAAFMHLPKSAIRITRGFKSKIKTIEIS